MESYETQKARFEAEQQKFWMALKEKLESFRDRGGASMAELADGLGVSRQPLYNFMKEPSEGLNKIDRLALLSLWAYLTDPKQYGKRKLTQENRDARQALAREGPDDLLRAVGFLGAKDLDKKAITVTDPQMKRLVLRLQSSWLYDDALRAYIIDGFLDDLLDQGRPNRDAYLYPLDYEKPDERKKIEEWPFAEEIQAKEKYRELGIRESYKRSIKNLVSSGKTEFVESELFELYQSIIEHRESRDGNNRIKIYGCEFETLSSNSILDRLNFERNQIIAEKRVSFNPEIITEKKNFPLIVEVKIRCDFEIENDEEFMQEAYFKYASTATHVENMLVAIKQGLCHPLDISGFFLRAVGRTDKSLARVAIALSEAGSWVDEKARNKKDSKYKKVEKVYQGWWVTSNTIIGIIKAFTDAFKRWLSGTDIRNSEYYEACRELAKVNESFYEVNKAIFEGNFDVPPDPNELEGKIYETLERIRKVENENLFEPIEEVRLRLKGKEFRITLNLLHLYIYKGNITKAKEINDEYQNPRVLVDKGVNSFDKAFKNLLVMSAYIEYMKYKLVTGDEEFLIGKLWRRERIYSLDEYQDVARSYVRQSGNINFNCYSFMAEFLATLGVMEFYAVENKAEYLERGREYLIEAAHYSSRIGYERKATQSLLYVVRCLSRLRVEDTDQEIQTILIEAGRVIDRKQSAQDMDWLNAIYHLSYGEKYLLIDDLPDMAIVEFLLAFRCTLNINYMRLVPDCLYDIYRACNRILKSGDEETMKEKIKGVIGDRKIRQEFSFVYEGIYIEDLNDSIGLAEEWASGKIDGCKVEEFGEACKKAATNLWDRWAKVEGYDEHAFSEHINSGSFLSPLFKD